MYKPRDPMDDEPGQAGGGAPATAAALSRRQILRAASPASSRPQGRLARFRTAIETRCRTIDLAPDLAQDIGSTRWFRGLGTMLGLGIVAVSFWPDMTAVEAATAMPVNPEVRDEFRSQMIMPLALGGDSGRHMGATPAVLPLRSAPERPFVQLVATLGQGDSFTRMLQRAGVGAEDSARIAALVGQALPPGEIAPGTQFDITLGKRPSPGEPRRLDAIDFRARFDLDLAVTRRDGALVLDRRPIVVDSTPLRIRGKVGSSLYKSARAAGAPLRAIQDYLRAVDPHLSIESDIAAEDEFDLILSYKRSAKGERQVGELLYAGLTHGGKPRLELMRWGKDGQFYRTTGVGRREVRQVGPVAGRLTSRFGMRRHPILGYRRMHSGVDFGAGYGAPIHAVSDGVVAVAGRSGGYGKYVRIEHGGGLGSGYAHMSRIAVERGARVRAGQLIGYVGSTGLSTGPHLHFEVYRGSRKIDPLSVKFLSQPQIDEAQLASFKQQLARLKQVEPGAALGDIAPARADTTEPRREIDRLSLHRREAPAAPDVGGAPGLAVREDGAIRRN